MVRHDSAEARPWTAAGAAVLLGSSLVLLAWMLGGARGLLTLVVYLAATVPGWPVGFALFGRRHAAAWVAGSLLGYALTCWTLWAALWMGLDSPAPLAGAWLAVNALTWSVPRFSRRREGPLITLPAWTSRDTRGLCLLLLLVPLVVALPFGHIGARDADGARRYRAYFTADFLWHMALTAQLSHLKLPPQNPYLDGEPLHYYWTYFLVPGTLAGVAGWAPGDDLVAPLAVNAAAAGTLFVAAIAVFAWASAPGRAAMWATALALLAASAEGAYLLWRFSSEGRSWEGLRAFNVDAATYWLFGGLTIDGLPRSLWYTPQHAGACALGLVALVIATRGARQTLAAAAAAGLSLAAAITFSPFLGGAFSVVYGLAVLLDAARTPRQAPALLLRHAPAAALAGAGVLACLGARMVEGAGDALHLGWIGHARRAPFLTFALALGPLAAVAIPGLLTARRERRSTALPSVAGLIVGLALFYFASLPSRDPIWVGWRAGQVLLVTLPALAARTLEGAARAGWRRPTTLAAALIAFLAGTPTTVLDLRNAQDVDLLADGPGFKWTQVVPPGEQAAYAWLRRATPLDATVQFEPNARGRDTWTHVPTFAGRRMHAGLPISLLRGPEYDPRVAAARRIFETADPKEALRLCLEAGIEYLFVGAAERAALPPASLEKFEQHPELFSPVFRNDAVTILAVAGPGAPR